MRQTSLNLMTLTLFGIFAISCSKGSDSHESTQSSLSFTEEPAFCSRFESVSNGVTIISRAQFQARQVTTSGLLGPGTNQDIKYAEVIVTNSSGAQIQCATTDASGNISLQIPRSPGTYNLKVNSRASGSFYNVSILNNPTQNLPYFISADFSVSASSSSLSVGLPVASFEGTLEGGAFNIMDQVYLANQFIRQNSSCPSQGSVCTPFSVAPQVRAYWTPGLSPYSYYGSPSTAISFYSKLDDPAFNIRRGLYIQGGIKGDVNCSDTDHFDNSVILHEYGHFLEDAFARSDSPGGSHNGNAIIDPRLAWSEGWSNFFQTAVIGTPNYRDTIGNSACTGGTFLGVNLNIETATSGQDKMSAGTTMGEGVFREVSVSRTLWDTIDSTGSDGGAGLGFALVWKTFSDSINGFHSSDIHFRNIGLFNQILRQTLSSVWNSKLSAFDAALSQEYQVASTAGYGQHLGPQSSGSCSMTLQGVPDTYSMGEMVENQFKSDAFFEIQYDGSYSSITLNYSGSGTPSDLDLYLYKENYVFDETTSILRTSARLYPESSGTGQESINLSGLTPGTYLINVRVNTARLGQAANYYLTTNSGARFCP